MSAVATECPTWCNDHRDELGREVHPDDRSMLHSREWRAEEWLRVTVSELVYESGDVGQRDVAIRECAPGADSHLCHWMTNLSGVQARALAQALIEAADLLDAAGGYVSGIF